jgi:dTDP-4-amino-4,6-dideoxygalactose transaminase
MSTTTVKPALPSIPLNNFQRFWSLFGEEIHAAMERVGSSGWYILGREVTDFENALAEAWGISSAIGVGNGLDAIEIGLRVLGLQQGEKVLTTPLSAFATTLAICRAGGIPVFVDVDASGQIDFEQAEELLQHEDIRFMVPVHLYGHAFSLAKLQNLKDKYNLRIVEDCAQAIGAASNGRIVGSVGDVCATSFYPTKNLGALGDGGALLSNDPTLSNDARTLRDYGQNAKYVHAKLGLNSRLDELQAAILHSVCLPRLPEWTSRRRSIAEQYLNNIRHPLIQALPVPEHSQSVWHLFPVLVPPEQRDDFMIHLKSTGVMSAIHYPLLIPEQPVFERGAGCIIASPLLNAGRISASEVSLPVHPFMDNGEIEQVIIACNQWQPESAGNPD